MSSRSTEKVPVMRAQQIIDPPPHTGPQCRPLHLHGKSQESRRKINGKEPCGQIKHYKIPTRNGPPNCIITTHTVESSMTQYMIMLMYFLFPRSKIQPAASPLHASKRRGHCPISIVPLACAIVTALSSVAKMHVISATSITSSMRCFLRVLRILPFLYMTAGLHHIAPRLRFLLRENIHASTVKSTERITASTSSCRTRLLLMNCIRIPAP